MEEPNLFKYKSVFVSDLHLGTSNSKAEEFNIFLKANKAENLYLVGDIIDLWRIINRKYGWRKEWTQSYNNAVRRILSAAKKGSKIFYITGNHDEYLRPYVNELNSKLTFGNIKLVNEAVHIGIDGKKYLVLHGDQYDVMVRNHRFISNTSVDLYDILIYINKLLSKVRNKLKLPKWSLSYYIKRKVKDTINFLHKYEELLVTDARNRGFDGIICGHTHYPELKTVDSTIYMNTGDWVDSMTALVETYEGEFKLITYEEYIDSDR